MSFPLALLTTQLLVAPVADVRPPNEAAAQTLQARARSVTWAGAAVTGTGAALWLTGVVQLRTVEAGDAAARRQAEHLATGGAATVAAGACVMAVGYLLWSEAKAPGTLAVTATAEGPAVFWGGRF